MHVAIQVKVNEKYKNDKRRMEASKVSYYVMGVRYTAILFKRPEYTEFLNSPFLEDSRRELYGVSSHSSRKGY